MDFENLEEFDLGFTDANFDGLLEVEEKLEMESSSSCSDSSETASPPAAGMPMEFENAHKAFNFFQQQHHHSHHNHYDECPNFINLEEETFHGEEVVVFPFSHGAASSVTPKHSDKIKKEIPSHSPKVMERKLSGPFSTPDKRKRKHSKTYGKVLSTIKSNRAKPAQVVECSVVPKKDQRIKGVVYCINGESKRWDGRQWRRLCVVESCHSAARGAGDLCIAHSKGQLKKVVIGDEVVEVVSLEGASAAKATAIAEVPEIVAAVAAATDGDVNPESMHPHSHFTRQLSKRKSEDELDCSPRMKMNKMVHGKDDQSVSGDSEYTD